MDSHHHSAGADLAPSKTLTLEFPCQRGLHGAWSPGNTQGVAGGWVQHTIIISALSFELIFNPVLSKIYNPSISAKKVSFFAMAVFDSLLVSVDREASGRVPPQNPRSRLPGSEQPTPI